MVTIVPCYAVHTCTQPQQQQHLFGSSFADNRGNFLHYIPLFSFPLIDRETVRNCGNNCTAPCLPCDIAGPPVCSSLAVSGFEVAVAEARQRYFCRVWKIVFACLFPEEKANCDWPQQSKRQRRLPSKKFSSFSWPMDFTSPTPSVKSVALPQFEAKSPSSKVRRPYKKRRSPSLRVAFFDFFDIHGSSRERSYARRRHDRRNSYSPGAHSDSEGSDFEGGSAYTRRPNYDKRKPNSQEAYSDQLETDGTDFEEEDLSESDTMNPEHYAGTDLDTADYQFVKRVHSKYSTSQSSRRAYLSSMKSPISSRNLRYNLWGIRTSKSTNLLADTDASSKDSAKELTKVENRKKDESEDTP